MATWSKFLNPNLSANLRNTLSLELELIQVSQDIANNRSTVKVIARIKGNGWGAYNELKTTGYIDITDNTRIPFELPSYVFNSGTNILLKESTVTIPHNNDGTKTVTATVVYDGKNAPWVGQATVTGSILLSTIPRASKFTASNVNAGSAGILITLSKSPAATTHKAKIMYDKTVICDKDIGANPTSIPLTVAEWLIFYNLTKNVTSGNLSVELTTYNNSTILGTDSKTVTASYAASDIPTLTGITFADTNSTVNTIIGLTNYLQLLSQIKLTVAGATGVKSSTITGYEIKVDTSAFSVNNPIWIPGKSGTFPVTARVKDSRGRWSASKTANITIIPYSRPSISATSARRSDSAGTLALLGTFGRIQFNASVSSVNVSGEKNTLRYKIDDVTAMNSPVNKVPNTTHSGLTASNAYKVVSSYPIGNTAKFLITITDVFGQTAAGLVNLPVAETPMTWGKKGIAVGGVFNKWGKHFQVYGDEEIIGGRLYIDGHDNTEYAQSIYNPLNGILIDTGLPQSGNYFLFAEIDGNGYANADIIDTTVQTYNYPATPAFLNSYQRNNGYPIQPIKFIIHDGKIKFWIPQLPQPSYTLRIKVYASLGHREMLAVPFSMTTSGEPGLQSGAYQTFATAIDNIGIHSTGTNANGTYIRYSDGTQLCYGTASSSNNGVNGVAITLPALFVNNAYIMTANAIGHASGGLSGAFVVELSAFTTSTVRLKVTINQATTITAAVDGLSVNYIAIGRWK